MNPTLTSGVLADPTAQRSAEREPRLPAARGPISERLLRALTGNPSTLKGAFTVPGDHLSDDDLHLSLYVCYEQHYRGFEGVDPGWEWNPNLIGFRSKLEQAFEQALREEYWDVEPDQPTVEAIKAVAAWSEGPSLSAYIRDQATLDQFHEFVIHRSAYQLKEADPHTWVIPRLDGAAKAALIEIQADEYGGGRIDRMHCTLFRKTMLALGLDGGYGAYLDRIPGVTLATVNLISMFGLHRRLRAAAVGHLAIFEMTSSQPNRRYGTGARRLGLSAEATDFYDEHVEADSVHEVIAAHDLAGGLANQDPELAAMIMFGARACAGLDARFASHVMDCWTKGVSSLRRP